MQQHELENLLVQLTPAVIRQRYGAELSTENETFLATYEGFDQRLDSLSESYIERFPPAPTQTSIFKENPKLSSPWYARSLRIPFWVVSGALAALFVLGFLSLYSSDRSDMGQEIHILNALSFTRSGDDEAVLKTRDAQLIQALLDRGYFFFEKGTESCYRKALSHFLLAYQINSQNPRSLKYLILVSQALGLDADTRRWIQELEALEHPEEAPQP